MFVFKVILPYLIEKLRDFMQMNDWAKRPESDSTLKDRLKFLFYRLVDKLTQLYKLLSLLHLLWFFSKGKRRSLIELLLGIRLTST